MMGINKTKMRIIRAISLLTLGFFLVNQVAYANPGAGIEIAVSRETPGFLQIDIPADLASLDDIYEAPPSADPKLILHIQNAHANYDAQQKIKQLLEHLNKTYSINTIFVEGASERLDSDYLKFFPDEERNLKLADFLAKEGELTGAEMYLLDQSSDDGRRMEDEVKTKTSSVTRPPLSAPAVQAFGIEDAGLYRANYEALKKVFGSEALVNEYTNGLESRLNALSSKIAGSDMRRMLSEWKKFEKGRREFMPYVKSLAADAKRVLGLDLERLFAQVEWPQLTRVLVLQQMEKELNPALALEEKNKLVKFLTEKRLSDSLIREIENFKDQHITVTRKGKNGAAEAIQPRYLLEKLAQEAGPKGFKFGDYPNFSLQSGYLILKSELDSRGLFAEINRLFRETLDQLAETPNQKELLNLHRDSELVRKLLNLELTRNDLKEAEEKKESLKPGVLMKRLKDLSVAMGQSLSATRNGQRATDGKKSLTVGRSALSAPKGGKFRAGVQDVYTAAYSFYDYARKRETVFYEKMSKVMASKAETKAVLITGGFHTDGVSDLFREHEISYGVLTPRLMEKSDENLYRTVMLQNREYPFNVSYLETAIKAARPEDAAKVAAIYMDGAMRGQDLPLDTVIAAGNQGPFAAKSEVRFAMAGKNAKGRSEIRILKRPAVPAGTPVEEAVGENVQIRFGQIGALAPVTPPAAVPARPEARGMPAFQSWIAGALPKFLATGLMIIGLAIPSAFHAVTARGDTLPALTPAVVAVPAGEVAAQVGVTRPAPDPGRWAPANGNTNIQFQRVEWAFTIGYGNVVDLWVKDLRSGIERLVVSLPPPTLSTDTEILGHYDATANGDAIIFGIEVESAYGITPYTIVLSLPDFFGDPSQLIGYRLNDREFVEYDPKNGAIITHQGFRDGTKVEHTYKHLGGVEMEPPTEVRIVTQGPGMERFGNFAVLRTRASASYQEMMYVFNISEGIEHASFPVREVLGGGLGSGEAVTLFDTYQMTGDKKLVVAVGTTHAYGQYPNRFRLIKLEINNKNELEAPQTLWVNGKIIGTPIYANNRVTAVLEDVGGVRKRSISVDLDKMMLEQGPWEFLPVSAGSGWFRLGPAFAYRVDGDKNVWVMNLTDDSVPTKIPGPVDGFQNVWAFSPDGTKIVVGVVKGGAGEVVVVDLAATPSRDSSKSPVSFPGTIKSIGFDTLPSGENVAVVETQNPDPNSPVPYHWIVEVDLDKMLFFSGENQNAPESYYRNAAYPTIALGVAYDKDPATGATIITRGVVLRDLKNPAGGAITIFTGQGEIPPQNVAAVSPEENSEANGPVVIFGFGDEVFVIPVNDPSNGISGKGMILDSIRFGTEPSGAKVAIVTVQIPAPNIPRRVYETFKVYLKTLEVTAALPWETVPAGRSEARISNPVIDTIEEELKKGVSDANGLMKALKAQLPAWVMQGRPLRAMFVEALRRYHPTLQNVSGHRKGLSWEVENNVGNALTEIFKQLPREPKKQLSAEKMMNLYRQAQMVGARYWGVALLMIGLGLSAGEVAKGALPFSATPTGIFVADVTHGIAQGDAKYDQYIARSEVRDFLRPANVLAAMTMLGGVAYVAASGFLLGLSGAVIMPFVLLSVAAVPGIAATFDQVRNIVTNLIPQRPVRDTLFEDKPIEEIQKREAMKAYETRMLAARVSVSALSGFLIATAAVTSLSTISSMFLPAATAMLLAGTGISTGIFYLLGPVWGKIYRNFDKPVFRAPITEDPGKTPQPSSAPAQEPAGKRSEARKDKGEFFAAETPTGYVIKQWYQGTERTLLSVNTDGRKAASARDLANLLRGLASVPVRPSVRSNENSVSFTSLGAREPSVILVENMDEVVALLNTARSESRDLSQAEAKRMLENIISSISDVLDIETKSTEKNPKVIDVLKQKLQWAKDLQARAEIMPAEKTEIARTYLEVIAPGEYLEKVRASVRSEARLQPASAGQARVTANEVGKLIGLDMMPPVEQTKLGPNLRAIKTLEAQGVEAAIIIAAVAGMLFDSDLTAEQMAKVIITLANANVVKAADWVTAVRQALAKAAKIEIMDKQGLEIELVPADAVIGSADLGTLANKMQEKAMVLMADGAAAAAAAELRVKEIKQRLAMALKELNAEKRFDIIVVDKSNPRTARKTLNDFISAKMKVMPAISKGQLGYVFMGPEQFLKVFQADEARGLMIKEPYSKDLDRRVAASILASVVSQRILSASEIDAIREVLNIQKDEKGFYSFSQEALNKMLTIAMQVAQAIGSAA